MGYLGRPQKETSLKQSRAIKISVTPDQGEMIDWLATNLSAKPKPTATFLNEVLQNVLMEGKFTVNVPGKAALEMRQHYKNVANNLNQLTRDYNVKREFMRDADKEAYLIGEEIKEIIRMTRELYSATMHHRVVHIVNSDFWAQIKARMNADG